MFRIPHTLDSCGEGKGQHDTIAMMRLYALSVRLQCHSALPSCSSSPQIKERKERTTGGGVCFFNCNCWSTFRMSSSNLRRWSESSVSDGRCGRMEDSVPSVFFMIRLYHITGTLSRGCGIVGRMSETRIKHVAWTSQAYTFIHTTPSKTSYKSNLSQKWGVIVWGVNFEKLGTFKMGRFFCWLDKKNVKKHK